MSRHDKKTREQPQPQPQPPQPPQPPPPTDDQPAITGLEYMPLIGQEDRPPLLANKVDVSGGADAVVLTFFYTSMGTIHRALPRPGEGQKIVGGPNIEVHGKTVTIRSEPIARIAIPLSVGTEMLMDIFEAMMDGMPDVQSSLADFGSRLSELILRVANKGAQTTPSDDSASPGDGNG